MSISSNPMIRIGAITVCVLLLAGLYARPAVAQAKLPVPGHIVIVIEENKSYDQIMKAGETYVQGLISRGATLTQMHAFHHPSQENYYELFSGSKQNISNDNCPKSRLDAPSLGGILKDANKSFAGYAENLPPGFLTAKLKDICHRDRFVVRHTPWLGFNDSFASTHDFSEFAPGDNLPTVAIVIPNLDNDMHDGSIQDGSDWLLKHIKPYVDWAETHNSLLILTWDEDNGHFPHDTTPPQNHIATILVGPMVKPCSESDAPYNNHDLLRTIEDMYQLKHIGNTETAKDIVGIWKTDSAAPGQPCPLDQAPKAKEKHKDKHKQKPDTKPEEPNKP